MSEHPGNFSPCPRPARDSPCGGTGPPAHRPPSPQPRQCPSITHAAPATLRRCTRCLSPSGPLHGLYPASPGLTSTSSSYCSSPRQRHSWEAPPSPPLPASRSIHPGQPVFLPTASQLSLFRCLGQLPRWARSSTRGGHLCSPALEIFRKRSLPNPDAPRTPRQVTPVTVLIFPPALLVGPQECRAPASQEKGCRSRGRGSTPSHAIEGACSPPCSWDGLLRASVSSSCVTKHHTQGA